jgi:DNA-binding NtrC family response regulator
MDTLAAIRQKDRALPVLILTGETAVETVVAAMNLGAYDYIVKPVDRARLLTSIHNAIERFRLALRVTELEREVRERDEQAIAGRSPVMRRLFQQIDRVAASDITVLIHGESGTGKELVAHALHEASPRRGGALIAVNCAAIPETLQESELFGHERGAFTGATERHKGKIEVADRGTLFLDEIGEITPILQAKLLRVLQERTFQRVGGTADLRSDFRLVAATNRDLAEEVRIGRFREDLFFRIAVFEIEVPPLRERGEDILLLARRFLAEAAEATGRPLVELAPEAAEALLAYPFPGNVRELQNAIQRALIVGDGARIERQDLPARILASGAVRAPGAPAEAGAVEPPVPIEADLVRPLTLAELEKQGIQAALARTQGNLSQAARELGIDRTTLYRKLRPAGGAAGGAP